MANNVMHLAISHRIQNRISHIFGCALLLHLPNNETKTANRKKRHKKKCKTTSKWCFIAVSFRIHKKQHTNWYKCLLWRMLRWNCKRTKMKLIVSKDAELTNDKMYSFKSSTFTQTQYYFVRIYNLVRFCLYFKSSTHKAIVKSQYENIVKIIEII